MNFLAACLLGTLTACGATRQEASPQAAARKPNELVAGKLVHVAPMPASLDQWIIDFLRRWGKYKLTGDPEGVDLVIRAQMPQKDTEYQVRGGVPRPRKEKEEPPVLSISVIDWVTNETLWRAEVLDKKQKKDEPEPPSGPVTHIFARGMTPDQLALKVTRKLQDYVTQLEKPGSENKTQQ